MQLVHDFVVNFWLSVIQYFPCKHFEYWLIDRAETSKYFRDDPFF